MLGIGNETLIADQWSLIESQAMLPTSPEEFFAPSGPMPVQYACLRAYERHYMRRKAVLQRQSEKYAIYVKDCSRTGMGVISPIQLFPCEQVQIWIEAQRNYRIEVKRCRKIGPRCYECGTEFILK